MDLWWERHGRRPGDGGDNRRDGTGKARGRQARGRQAQGCVGGVTSLGARRRTRCATRRTASFRLRDGWDKVATFVHDVMEAPLQRRRRGGGRDGEARRRGRHCSNPATTAIIVRLKKAGGSSDVDVDVVARHAEGGSDDRGGVMAGADGRWGGRREHGERDICSQVLWWWTVPPKIRPILSIRLR